jgi:elongation factor P
VEAIMALRYPVRSRVGSAFPGPWSRLAGVQGVPLRFIPFSCARRRSRTIEVSLVKVAASSLRKGSVVDIDSRLYVVLSMENIHPGKGTPVTQLDMRRIADGVKVSERYRTTEQVERAFVDERDFNFLYSDGDGFHFMNPENYDQVTVPTDMVGDAAAYLQDGMTVTLSLHNDVPIAIELPTRATLEIVDTEPVVKGQTASGSYKPAMLSNGVRTMIPPYLTAGTRIVVMTADGSYVERAKD